MATDERVISPPFSLEEQARINEKRIALMDREGVEDYFADLKGFAERCMLRIGDDNVRIRDVFEAILVSLEERRCVALGRLAQARR